MPTIDAVVESVRTGTTDPMTWTHTPIGRPRAIVVALTHGVSSTDHVLSVTYGGVSMTRIVRATDTATEPGAAELWFLGAGIPTGAQTVSADLASATTDDIQGVSFSLLAAEDCEVIDFDSISENAADPTRLMSKLGRAGISIAAMYGGGAAPGGTLAGGNTLGPTEDLTAFYAQTCYETAEDNADHTIGWSTLATDDLAFVCLCVVEKLPVATAMRRRIGPPHEQIRKRLPKPAFSLEAQAQVATLSSLERTRVLGSVKINPSIPLASLVRTRSLGTINVVLTVSLASIERTRVLGAIQINPSVSLASLVRTRSLGSIQINPTIPLASLVRSRVLGSVQITTTVALGSLTRTRVLGAIQINPTINLAALDHGRTLGSLSLPIATPTFIKNPDPHIGLPGGPTIPHYVRKYEVFSSTIALSSLVRSRSLGSISINPRVVLASISRTRVQGSLQVNPSVVLASLVHTRSLGTLGLSPGPQSLVRTRVLGSIQINPQIVLTSLVRSRVLGGISLPPPGGSPSEVRWDVHPHARSHR